MNGFTIDRGGDGELGAHTSGKLVRSRHDGTNRGGGIPVFALKPFPRAELPVACRHVIHDGEACDGIRSLLFGGAAHGRADHDDELRFPVPLGGFRGVRNVVRGTHEGVRELREQGGVLGQVPSHLENVVAVVEANAQDLARARYESLPGGIGDVAGGTVRRGNVRPRIQVQQFTDVASVEFDNRVALDANGPRSAIYSDCSDELVLSISSQCVTVALTISVDMSRATALGYPS